jgi:hypothetical protein
MMHLLETAHVEYLESLTDMVVQKCQITCQLDSLKYSLIVHVEGNEERTVERTQGFGRSH